jgi:hypothetical protein
MQSFESCHLSQPVPVAFRSPDCPLIIFTDKVFSASYPRLLWSNTVDYAAGMALTGLLRKEITEEGTRSWTEASIKLRSHGPSTVMKTRFPSSGLDHNHSTVSGDLSQYPLRRIIDGDVGSPDSNGYSVSGFVRTAELLTRDGIKAYDGAGCRDVPTLSGILSDGAHLHASKSDTDGSVCGKAQTYTSRSYVAPKPLPAGSVVVAANAGSDYLFVPDGNFDTVKAVVITLQSRMQFGAIFVSDKYGEIPGTLPMSLINTENKVRGRSPDIIVSFSFDENAVVAGRREPATRVRSIAGAIMAVSRRPTSTFL